MLVPWCRLEAALVEEHKKPKPSLAWALCRAFGPTFLVASLYKLVYDSLMFVGE
jgi:hypothetical protein